MLQNSRLEHLDGCWTWVLLLTVLDNVAACACDQAGQAALGWLVVDKTNQHCVKRLPVVAGSWNSAE